MCLEKTDPSKVEKISVFQMYVSLLKYNEKIYIYGISIYIIIVSLVNMESNRQKKVARLIQKDLSEIFLLKSKDHYQGIMITITHVLISKDLSVAKVYLSIFPDANKQNLFNEINVQKNIIKHELSFKMKHQMRKTPDLLFFLDNSLDHYETINNLLKDI